MSDEQDFLNKRKQSLLVELESIKHLLDDKPDTIPVLKDAVVEQEVILSTPSPSIEDKPQQNRESQSTSEPQSIEEPIPNNGVLPGQQALFDEEQSPAKKPTTQNSTPTRKPAPRKNLSNNPFLPEHVRRRLDQTSAALTSTTQASTTQTSREPIKPTTIHSHNASYTEQLVDQLVEQYLPKIEADLRARLLAAVKPQTNNKNQE